MKTLEAVQEDKAIETLEEDKKSTTRRLQSKKHNRKTLARLQEYYEKTTQHKFNLHQKKDEEKGEGSKDAPKNNPSDKEEETKVTSKQKDQMDIRCDLD